MTDHEALLLALGFTAGGYCTLLSQMLGEAIATHRNLRTAERERGARTEQLLVETAETKRMLKERA